MTMSWLAERKATTSAASAVTPGSSARVGQAQRQDRERQQRLHASSAQPRRRPKRARDARQRQAVDDRRPHEFEAVGHADQREEADRGLVDAGLGQPEGEGRSVSGSGRPLEKPIGTGCEHARLEIDREAGGVGLRAPRARRLRGILPPPPLWGRVGVGGGCARGHCGFRLFSQRGRECASKRVQSPEWPDRSPPAPSSRPHPSSSFEARLTLAPQDEVA